MIVAIERNKFNYLYKYNEVLIDKIHLGDIDVTQLSFQQVGREKLVSDFDQMLPSFEEDHEVILLKVDDNKVQLGDRCAINFNAILSIYPLTSLASKLLEGRLNSNFKIESPIFESIVESVKLKRSLHTRLETIKVLAQFFSLAVDVHESSLKLLYDAAANVVSQKRESNYFEHLLSYNKTPSYVPEGNVEYLCKIGIVAMRTLGQNEDSIVKGPFYKSCLAHKVLINKGNLFDAYKSVTQLPDEAFQLSFKKIEEAISKGTPGVDVFKISYFFIAFRNILIQNEKTLEKIEGDIYRLVDEDRECAKWVIALLGFAFSFENLYESIHLLTQAPLLKEQRKLNKRKTVNINVAEPELESLKKNTEELLLNNQTQAEVDKSSILDKSESNKESIQEAKSDKPSVTTDANQPLPSSETQAVKLNKKILIQKIQTLLEKKDAKAWAKHLEERFMDFDELSWEDVRLSIMKSKAKHFTKDSNQKYVKGFFDE